MAFSKNLPPVLEDENLDLTTEEMVEVNSPEEIVVENKEKQEEGAGLGSAFRNEQGEAYETEQTPHGLIIKKPIVDEMRKSYLDYAMSVIVARALPDVRDGLKPVHRRILFAMSEMGIRWNTAYKKSARIVGEVLGKYHPHGDSAVYDALVRLAQDFAMRYPLVDGQGNFGSIDGDSPAAMRYTEARMGKISEELLADLSENTVPFTDNFDGSQREPAVLPARLPNLLLMGAEGIAVGMATKIPPHNIREVTSAILAMVEKGSAQRTIDGEALVQKAEDPVLAPAEALAGEFSSEADLDLLLEHIKGPDFPTAGTIYDAVTIRDVYATGRGSITMRAKAEIVENKSSHQIVITELPYQVNKAKLVMKIASLVRAKKIEGITGLRDESDRQGLSVVVDLKRGTRPKAILNQLYKHTELQSNFPVNMVALTADGTPQLFTLRGILTSWLKHRQLVTVRRLQQEVVALRDRAHILEGLRIALANLDEVIKTIRQAPDVDTARSRLMERFALSERQASAILDMQLRRLAALERQKIEDEYQAIQKRLGELSDILLHPAKIVGVITKEITELATTYGDDRRTKVVKGRVGEFSEEDLIPLEPAIVTFTESGYIKRLKAEAYRTQQRGGKGVQGMTTKEDDPIKEIISCTTHDTLLLFTNTGRVFTTRVYELPEGQRQAKGTALVNVVNLNDDEKVQTILCLPVGNVNPEANIVFATTQGKVKRTPLSEFNNVRSNGIIAIVLKDGDRVVYTELTSGKDDLLLVTHEGKCIRFGEDEVKLSHRDTQGVTGINLKANDYVVGGELIRVGEKPELLIITEKGLGKRTKVDEYPSQKRAGQGVKVSEITAKTGPVAAALVVNKQHSDVIISTKEAQVIKLPLKNVPILKRPTQGVILMRLPKGDQVVASTVTLAEEVLPSVRD